MMLDLTYPTFHLIFTIPVFVVIAAVYFYRRLHADDWSPWGTVLVTFIAFTYTTPWDSYMIGQEVWWYGDGVLLARFWRVPVGEYFFFVIQPLITGFWLYIVLTRLDTDRAGSWTPRWLLTAAGVGITAIGWWWAQGTPTFYLGMILVWAGPVLVLQWGYGGHYLLRNIHVVAAGVTPATLYLASADRVAIENGVWVISEELTTGIYVLGLPVEEGLFFLVTNLLVVQGIMLFRWTLDEWRVWSEEYESFRSFVRVLPVSGP